MTHYRTATERKPNFRLAHLHAGRLELERDRVAEAIEHLEKTLGPRDAQTPIFMTALATAYARRGETERAVALTREAKEMAIEFDQRGLAEAIDRELQKFQTAGGAP